jgi:predicted nucleotidyltransferase
LKSDINKFPTIYPDVNQVLKILLKNVRVILGDYFVGMYLYGSLASGDFDPGRSDIDFLVVTSKELPGNIVAELKSMHTRLYKSGMEWANIWRVHIYQ